jgi:hypothetical protein
MLRNHFSEQQGTSFEANVTFYCTYRTYVPYSLLPYRILNPDIASSSTSFLMMKNWKAKSAHVFTPVSQDIREIQIVLAMATYFEIHKKKGNKSQKEEDKQSLFLSKGNPLCVRIGLRSGLIARLNEQKRASPTHIKHHATTHDHTATERKGGHIT